MDVKRRNEQFLSWLASSFTARQYYNTPERIAQGQKIFRTQLTPSRALADGCPLCGKDHEVGPCWQFDYEVNR